MVTSSGNAKNWEKTSSQESPPELEAILKLHKISLNFLRTRMRPHSAVDTWFDGLHFCCAISKPSYPLSAIDSVWPLHSATFPESEDDRRVRNRTQTRIKTTTTSKRIAEAASWTFYWQDLSKTMCSGVLSQPAPSPSEGSISTPTREAMLKTDSPVSKENVTSRSRAHLRYYSPREVCKTCSECGKTCAPLMTVQRFFKVYIFCSMTCYTKYVETDD